MQAAFRKEKRKPQGLVPGWAGGEDRAGPPLSSRSRRLHVPFATNDQQPGGRENSTSLTVGVGGRENPPEKPWETALMAVSPQTEELGVHGCAE